MSKGGMTRRVMSVRGSVIYMGRRFVYVPGAISKGANRPSYSGPRPDSQ